MISMMEIMEKKTPLIKKNQKRKGMTLVEIMAAMAVLSILFIGMSGLIGGIVKSETKANRKLESDGYLKNALLMFESGIVSPVNLQELTVGFDDIEEMRDRISKLQNVGSEEENKYIITIESELINGKDLYKIKATLINSKDEQYSKQIYVLNRY